jgi:hypothetical protein
VKEVMNETNSREIYLPEIAESLTPELVENKEFVNMNGSQDHSELSSTRITPQSMGDWMNPSNSDPSPSYSPPPQPVLLDYALVGLVKGAFALVAYLSEPSHAVQQDEQKKQIERETERELQKERIRRAREEFEREREIETERIIQERELERERIRRERELEIERELERERIRQERELERERIRRERELEEIEIERERQEKELERQRIRREREQLEREKFAREQKQQWHSLLRFLLLGFPCAMKFSPPWLVMSGFFSVYRLYVSSLPSIEMPSIEMAPIEMPPIEMSQLVCDAPTIDGEQIEDSSPPKYLNAMELYKNLNFRQEMVSFMKKAYSPQLINDDDDAISLPISMSSLGIKLGTKNILIKQYTSFTSYNQIWIGIPGTQTMIDWIKNTNVTNTKIGLSEKLLHTKSSEFIGHAGFISVINHNYELIKRLLLQYFPLVQKSQIFLVGHSLGAALAHVLAVALACDSDLGEHFEGRIVLITMGQPQVWSTLPLNQPSYLKVNRLLGDKNVLRLIACSKYWRDVVTMMTGIGSGIASIIKESLTVLVGKMFLFKHSGRERFVTIPNGSRLNLQDRVMLHSVETVYEIALLNDVE